MNFEQIFESGINGRYFIFIIDVDDVDSIGTKKALSCFSSKYAHLYVVFIFFFLVLFDFLLHNSHKFFLIFLILELYVAVFIILDKLHNTFVVFIVGQFTNEDEVTESGLFCNFMWNEDYAVFEESYRSERVFLFLDYVQKSYFFCLVVHSHLFGTVYFAEKGREHCFQLKQPLSHQKLFYLFICLVH